MLRIPHVILVLVAIASSACGNTAAPASSTPAPITPTTPTPLPLPTRYTLSGTVKEAWIGTGLPGATVTIATGPSSGSAITNEHGAYTLSNLVPGIYRVTFSKAAPYGSVTYGPVNVFADAEFSGALSLTGEFPVTAANLQGYWVAQGPYANEPGWILLIQNGTRLEGWYKDRRDYSTSMSGTYSGGAVAIAVGTSGLTIEGRVEDERCIRAVIKNEALGGNFPVMISRGGSCSR
jgi:hypothetical protein